MPGSRPVAVGEARRRFGGTDIVNATDANDNVASVLYRACARVWTSQIAGIWGWLDYGCLTGSGVKGWNKDRAVQATDVLTDRRAVRDRVTTIDTD